MTASSADETYALPAPAPVRVVLLGLMGAGKSTVGKALAAQLGWPYLDNDDVLHERTGHALPEVARQGVEVLHRAERDGLRWVLTQPPPMVASGAASVVDDIAVREALHVAAAFTVYLHAEPAVLNQRLLSDRIRPWLRPDPLTALIKMYRHRDPLFREVASLVVDAAQPPDDIVTAIFRQLPRPM